MSVVDLHPEELLDRHADGSLSDTERARLGAHVATCAACRFELAARRDFADAAALRPRLALVIDPSLGMRNGTASGSPPAPGSAPSWGSAVASFRPAPGRRRRPAAALFLLAAALVGGVSLAAIAVRVVGERSEGAVARTNGSAGESRRVGGTRAGAPNAGTEGATVRLDELPLAPVKTAPSEALRTERRAPSASPAIAPSIAAALFREANAARRDGEGARAIQLYRRLESQHPSSEEARLSYATLGRLLLDRGDARSALDAFDEYLSHGGGALGEEAIVGRALSLQRLGSESAEIAAWQEILRRFPRSVHARLARSRLSALGQQ